MTALEAADAANGFSLRLKIHETFKEMDTLEDAARSGVCAAIVRLRDLSIRAELLAERGAACFPASRYHFERLRILAREGAEIWQDELDVARAGLH
jgi:hypothetical protein